ncbi:MAG: hypothetical protein J7L14_03040, partial [Candidatus Diapherotrites archaeon]|nr:hypothetical protein [Candidatus Diapherotrites archaeon]
RWPFKAKEFDYVVALELLEHLFKPETLLQKIAKTTNKYAIFSAPNAAYIKNRIQLLFGKVPTAAAFRNGQHLQHWNFKDFIQLIEGEFEIINFAALGSLPPFTRFLSFKAREMLGKMWPNLLGEGFVVKAKPKQVKA